MRSTPFLVKIKLALGVGLILVAAVGGASYVTINRLVESAQARVRTEDTLVLLERIASSLKSAESLVRQYLLTGSATDLQNVEAARAALREAIGRVRSADLLLDQPALDDLIAQRRTATNQVIAVRQSEGQEAAVAILNSDANLQLRQRTDSLLDKARSRENLAWQGAQADAERSAERGQHFIIAAGALFLAMLGWMVYVVTHYEEVRKRVESQLRDSETMTRTITESMADAVITTTDHDIVLQANAAALQLFGYEKNELIGRDVSELVPERLRAQYKSFTAALRARPEPFRMANQDVQSMRKNGTEFPASVSFGDVHVGGQRLFTALISDNTERRRITEALRASESQLRQITDTVPALIAYLDLEQRFRFHNRAYEEVLGLEFEQIDGHLLADVLGPQLYEGVQDKVDEVLRGYAVQYERVQVTRQGDRKNYAMQYFPRYGEGADEGKVVGFFSLGTDITELKRIDRMKTEFVSTVSHELRTPLTSIRGSLGLISGGVAGELPVAVKSLVAIATSNCERLIRLINDMLDSEKIESGKLRLNLQAAQLKPLLQQALAANEGFAAHHGVRLRLRAPDAALQARIDSDRLMQVMTNLLSNAVKFSPAGNTVEVMLSRTARQVRIEVSDQGPGIPEAFRNRIFQKFSQADSSDTRQKGGSGLGLNISRGLVENMGGRIGFNSNAGVGTTFFFELPEWREPAQLLQLVKARSASSRPRILICEDDPDVAQLISIMLGKAGFDADQAHSAEQALACLARKDYDAMTVDLKLPGQNGLAFIGALRREEKTRNLPVVVISAKAGEGELQFKRKPLAVSDWLEKPIDEHQLTLSVRRAVAGLQARKPRILHVEDDLDIQHIAAAIAENFATFEFAATLEQARARLREQRFDLVLLDLTLGSDSGWDLFEDIDALDPRPPVILFSSSDVDPEDSQMAEAVLVKAHTSNTELLNTIQRILQIPGDPGPTRPQPLI